MSHPIVFHNTVVYPDADAAFRAEAFAVRDGRVVAVGGVGEVRGVVGADAILVDLDGGVVVPGFVESHVHLTMLGQALDKVPLRECETIDDVRDRVRRAREAEPDAPHVLGVGWRFDIFNGQQPTAALLDEAVNDIPVILDANDLHSAWTNTAGLHAMGIVRDTPDPIGGRIVRDDRGEATGFLLETAAIDYAWSYVARASSPADLARCLDAAFTAYLATGVTAATDMSFAEGDLATLEARLERDGRLPFPVDAHWLLSPTGDVAADRAEIARIAGIRDAVRARHGDDWLRIVGIKVILDGVIDACTAAMRAPFANGTLPPPIWEPQFAIPAAVAADAVGLELAMHAIGDEASTIALDMVAAVIAANGERDRRPRVEHLEYVAPDTVARMVRLGVTASIQPVHADPAVLDNWKAMLGDERAEHGFPWHELRQAGVNIAIGTDAPTAPHETLRNLFIALTGRSALDPERGAYHTERVFTVSEALTAMTRGAAFATSREHEFGRLTPGLRANFAVLNIDPFTAPAEMLLTTAVRATYVDGRRAL